MIETTINQNSLEIRKRKPNQAWIFLIIWPFFNIGLISSALYLLNHFNIYLLLQVTIKIWSVFFVGYLLFNIFEALFKRLLTSLIEQYIWLYRPIVIFLIFIWVVPIVEIPLENNVSNVKFLPVVVLLLESLIYMAVMYIFQQQELHYQTCINAQKTELQMLKMQSNPHFLFNTLNLIATEISRDPPVAKELIYNLSDLLRDTVRLSNNNWATLEEELQLVELYLLLQHKRFDGRLAFDIDCPAVLKGKLVPSLLLLPVVENSIKHGIAPFVRGGHVSIKVELQAGYLKIEVHDTGPAFDDNNIQEGQGLRILSESLKLHFAGNYSMNLSSSIGGTSMVIRIPEVTSYTNSQHLQGSADETENRCHS
ncbi:sensor histidine kinase [Microbulbifer sp. THAF38]|uniref:sensor histidine kinase n=1 Tax=Microbulbifer sp. THAF38 TaxID=2587856 RepID=UPI0012680CA0|nr:histidine kinase [Microbulbifer sp. THAF38]QFT54367.1 Sensor histidine kinase YehU [Microbulbifer sp. THAF38]